MEASGLTLTTLDLALIHYEKVGTDIPCTHNCLAFGVLSDLQASQKIKLLAQC